MSTSTTQDPDIPNLFYNNEFSNTNPNQLFDWFKNFSVPTSNSLFPFNQFTIQTINFLKPFLKDFYPGSIIQPATTDKPAFKNNFDFLFHTIALQKPKFITDIILNSHPHITSPIDIPTNFIHITLKKLILEFTTTLFQHFNYLNIFNSYLFIPSYSIKKRFQIIINLARLHL